MRDFWQGYRIESAAYCCRATRWPTSIAPIRPGHTIWVTTGAFEYATPH